MFDAVTTKKSRKIKILESKNLLSILDLTQLINDCIVRYLGLHRDCTLVNGLVASHAIIVI